MSTFNEDSRVKIPALLHLTRLGYEYLSLKSAQWDARCNIFTELFKSSVSRINPRTDAADIQRLLDDIHLDLQNDDLGNAFHKRLTTRSGLRLIDFDNLDNSSYHVVNQADRFSYDLNEAAIQDAERFDGKLVLLTNVTDFGAEQIVSRYKSLADIERGFRVLKSDLDIAPVLHRLPDRIRAHALICFLALVLYRVMRMRLKAHARTVMPAAKTPRPTRRPTPHRHRHDHRATTRIVRSPRHQKARLTAAVVSFLPIAR